MYNGRANNRLCKKVVRGIALAVTVVLCSHVAYSSKSQNVFDKDEMTATEEDEVRSVAKRFTKRLYETKDVAPLIEEFFVSDFLKHASPLDDKSSHANIFAQLSEEEQRRLYVAALNWMYYVSLSAINERDSNGESSAEESLERLFTPTIGRRLASLKDGAALFADADGDGHTDPANPEALREFLPRFERTIAEARDHLRHLPPEQSPVLTRESARWEKDDAYSMKSYWDEDLPADTEAYQVFLPILLDIVLVKVDGQWKVWAMFSDGD